MNFIKLLIIFSILLVAFASKAQSKNDTIKVRGFITLAGDTIPSDYLEPIEVSCVRILTKEQRVQKQEWTRLKNAVYVTYPYAKTSGKIMNEINAKLVGVKERKDRKKIIKAREKELRKEFGDKISNLSIYQGKVMMKLIYRETGNSCYEIIEEYKGGLTAFLYQSIAVIVGTNLKQSYDAKGTDVAIEQIVIELEKMYGYRR